MSVKVIIDTNILIGSTWDEMSHSKLIVDEVIKGNIECFATNPTIRENKLLLGKAVPNPEQKKFLEDFFAQVREVRPRERVHIVHRLDREVSGILVFARSLAAKNAMQEHWAGVQKHYLALVHGVPLQAQGTFSSYLVKNGVHSVHSTTDPKQGKLSHTAYEVLGHSQGISLLDVHLLTGRKHQIRVHLAEHKLPIVGDKKYGEKRTAERRLALHAKSLAFDHPHSGEPCFFETRVPHFFSRMLVSK